MFDLREKFALKSAHRRKFRKGLAYVERAQHVALRHPERMKALHVVTNLSVTAP
jgi:hypothetical protein